MKNKFLSKCIISILLGSFLASAVAPAVPAMAATASEESVEGMELAAENNDIAMYYDKETAQVTFVYKDSGRVIETKVLDSGANATIQDYQKSELILEYYEDDRAGGTKTVTTNKLAIGVDLNEEGDPQVIYESLENGLKVSFILRENKLSMDVVPKIIPEEKWREKIWKYLDDKEKKFIETYYSYRSADGGYRRSKDGSDEILQSTIEKVRNIIFKGDYTEADMEEDNIASGYESTWSNLEIKMSIVYELDGDEILVKVPVSEITVSDEEIIVSSLDVLRYFTSATQEENGYFVVPDGIGAVINFNSGLTKAGNYVSRIYGDDTIIDADSYSSLSYYANMPIYGMVYDDYAMVSIVEEGDTLAELTTEISGKTDEFNKAYWKFYLTEKENVSTSATSTVSVNKFTGDTFTDDIVIRYLMLEEEETNYTGVAKAYQEYLIEQGVLTKNERKEDASLYLEILGSVKENKNFLGIPYQGISALTTFEETKKMLEYFKISGVKDIEAELVGWMNDGDNHYALTDIDIDSVMGSKTQLGRITDFAHEYEFGFYAALNLQTVYASDNIFNLWSTSSFAGKYASKFLSNEYAQLGTAKLGLDKLKINNFSGYLVSPTKLKTYTSKVMKELSKFNLEGLSLRDIGSLLVADYNSNKNVSRENAAVLENEAIGMLAEDYKIMLSNPDAYAWKYADVITNMPSRSNEYTVFAYDIPLLPLVLDGCVSYSTTPLNYDTQKELSEMILKCIETRMNPKFYLMYAEMSELENTEEHYDELSINYNTWRKDIVSLYEEYNEFYELVRDADFESHETLAKNVVKVTYTNGVEVYVNYTRDDYRVANGPTIEASSYLIVE